LRRGGENTDRKGEDNEAVGFPKNVGIRGEKRRTKKGKDYGGGEKNKSIDSGGGTTEIGPTPQGYCKTLGIRRRNASITSYDTIKSNGREDIRMAGSENVYGHLLHYRGVEAKFPITTCT